MLVLHQRLAVDVYEYNIYFLQQETDKVDKRASKIVGFVEKISSCACLVQSGLSDIFKCKVLSSIFSKVISSSAEKSEVSSAKSFTLQCNRSGKSLM